MKSKERVKKIFSHTRPDRVAFFDFFDKITILNWQKQIFLKNINTAEYFNFDIEFIESAENFKTINCIQSELQLHKDKFVFLKINGPFQRFVNQQGLQKALIATAKDPNSVKDFFNKSVNDICSEYDKILSQNCIDGIWFCEDLCYDNGLYFSLEKYKDLLFQQHKRIVSYFLDKNIATALHCDGNIETLIEFAVKSGFCAMHPMQESCNANLLSLKKDYGQQITFIGGVSTKRINSVHQDIFDRIYELKEGGSYVFCFDSPIMPDIDFDLYNEFINNIEKVGVYL